MHRNLFRGVQVRTNMKFARETEEVAWTTDEHMAYCNLPNQLVQHWSCVHELNGYLMELVRSLSIGYRVARFPLNPMAPEFEGDVEKDINKNNTTEVEEKQATTKTITNEWVTPNNTWKKQNPPTNRQRRYENMHNILVSLCEEEEKQQERAQEEAEASAAVLHKIYKEIKSKEEKHNMETQQVNEMHDVEKMQVDVLESIITRLNDDYAKSQVENHAKNQQLKYDIACKNDETKQLKEKLKRQKDQHAQIGRSHTKQVDTCNELVDAKDGLVQRILELEKEYN